MRTVTLQEYLAELRAQGVPRLHVAHVCPVCKTVQSLSSLLATGKFKDAEDAERYEGFSCIGRNTNAGPHRDGHDGIGCDWTLGGLLTLHTLEVIAEDGTKHMRFEPATKEQAKVLMTALESVSVTRKDR
jgi:hypothetical protein